MSSFTDRDCASCKIRVETIHYFLRRYREDMLREQEEKAQIERQLAAYESILQDQLKRQLAKTSHSSSTNITRREPYAKPHLCAFGS